MFSTMQSALRPVASSPEQRQQQQQQQQHAAPYEQPDFGLERHNSHDSNGSSNFTHRAHPPLSLDPSRSSYSFHSSQPDIASTPSPSSSRLAATNYSRPRLEHAQTQPSTPHHSHSGPRSYFSVEPHSHSFSGPSGHGISSSFDEDELRQIMSRSPGADLEACPDGDVAKGVKSANHQDISPFLFQNESAAPSSSRSSRANVNAPASASASPATGSLPLARTSNATTTHHSLADTSFGSIDNSGLVSSRSQHSLRPHTPPSATTSSSTLNGSRDTHASAAKKSRNPFGFLKKKPSTHSNASSTNPVRHEASMSSLSSRYGSNAANLNPMRPPAWLDHNRPLATTTSPSSASLRSHYHNPSTSASASWQNPLHARIDALPTAVSLEDELDNENQPKKDARKRIKGVRHHLGKNAHASKLGGDDADTARDPAFAAQSHSIEQEVELSLDMNFDQLEDFVDTNAARQRLQGSVTESTSPSDHRSPNGSEAGLHRSPSPSQNSLVDRHTSVASTLDSPSEASAAASSSLRQPSRTNTTMSTSTSTSTILSDRRPSQINLLPRNSVPRLSMAEMQNYQSLRKLSSNLIDLPQPSSLPLRRESIAATHASPESSQLGVASSADAILPDYRKDSVVSAHSMRSNHSGISPKTSYANLPSAIQEHPKGSAGATTPSGAGWASEASKDKPANGRADHAYQFPPAPDHNGTSLLSVRKSSASSGQEPSSSWMAPDSWAVQPDKMRDYLRDDNVGEEEDDDQDRAMAALASEGKRRGSSSGMSSTHASSMFRTSSTDPFKKTTSLAGSRRATDESVDPLTVLPPLPGSKPIDDASANKVDVLQQTNNLAQSALAQQQSQNQQAQTHQLVSTHIRPSSRGGAGAHMLASAGASAAAAAAGKLGLHRPSKHRTTTRPNTAGSIGATRPSTTTLSSTLSAEDDSSVNGSIRRDPHPLKRSTTANTGAPPGNALRNHFIRVYKQDSTFATLSCSLVSTANEVQTTLARKSLTAESAAYRLFVRDKGSERPLGISDKPAQLQRRRLLQAGYTENDGLEDIGRDDLSYLLRFVFRPDSVPTFDSESIGHSEHTFQRLDLQSRNLEMVPIFLYKHADWIVSLDLSGNPMSDLPLDFVQLCSSLRTLRLSNLALKRIPQSVRHSETLTHLDVSNNRIVELSHISLDLIPELMSLKVQNNRLFDLPPYFSGIRTLRNLNISNNRFDEFPSVICDVPSLVDLDVSFNSITELPAEIANLVNLERFILAANSLEKLPDSMSELVNLRTIDLRRNKVQDVSSLLGLPRLQNIQAESNNIKSFEATLGPQLTQVELGRNPLSKVRIAALTTCDLTSLDLSSTNMTRLEEGLFPQLPALVKLTLDGNQLVVLPDTLGELKRLEMLSCSNNLLATLPESIGDLKALKELLVHNNNLKTLPQSLWFCESLAHINLSSNLLESFPAAPDVRPDASTGDVAATAIGTSAILAARKGSTSSSLTHRSNTGGANGGTNISTPSELFVAPLSFSLQKLRLGDNRLGDEVFSVLSELTSLEVLNLSFNEIFEIPDFSLQTLTKLRELYISGNQLSTIPSDDLVVLQELRILHLNCNKLTTLPVELGKLKKLANLDVGNNVLKYNIANWHYDWNWNMNPELRYLNLSGNTRLEIKTKLSDMGFTRKSNISDFSRLTSLRMLGLMDVTMPLHSNATPDESDNRRVRTSLSQINGMAYGIADALGKHDNLSVIDLVIPTFRKDEGECIFGLFDGRGHGAHVGSRIAHHLAEWSGHRLSWEFQKHQNEKASEPVSVPDALRRAFLRLQKDYADALINDGNRKLSEAHAEAAADVTRSSAPAIAAASNKHDWRAGASAILAYMVERTLYIANAGDALAVMSRNGGTAHLISSKHEPFDRAEIERIRSAEGWVSLRGYVNDMLDVSRSFGYYHLFPIVNAAPAVTTVQLTDSDEFVIIANRTLWQYVSYQTAVDIARTQRNDPMIAAQKLRDFAISYGAEESIMVMVISVGDLFYRSGQRNGGGLTFSNYQNSDAIKKAGRRFREELPSDRTLARLDREVAPPIGQVALVFTDIKNSTSLWETNNGMQTAMRLHNYLLRRQLRTIGGYEVKTEGDAFMVSFPSVSAALLWCFTVQQQLLQEDWPREILDSEDGKEVYDPSGELIHRGLSVRMGIHWGRPVCEADPITRRMDYFGPMVNRAARISGAADGGQILASKDVIKELQGLLGTFDESSAAAGSGEGQELEKTEEELDEDAFRLLNPNVSRDVVLLRRMGFGLSQLGERRLKGLETPEMLWLVYPKQLAGRLEQAKTDDAPDAPTAQVYEPTVQLLDIEDVKQVGMLCLRLEYLSNSSVCPGIFAAKDEAERSNPSTPLDEVARNPMDGGGDVDKQVSLVSSSNSNVVPLLSLQARRKGVEAMLSMHPELLIYSIRDDATDEELAGILDQLTTRIQNAVSSLALNVLREKTANGSKDLGADPSVLDLLASLLSQPPPRASTTTAVALPSPLTSPRGRLMDLHP
ncbi:Adenylate cyclase [Sporisorium reilianum SRZ2]|uniref:Adenylate cyclase n=1 Tax=Sporisorium reilianum (strain SRZ2) TaxID=999809 RepID=E6ZYX6_SPORE|nr:Adenylate cyclase [Sporisorium reilianum SRZ2]